jgi:hypothetical protein
MTWMSGTSAGGPGDDEAHGTGRRWRWANAAIVLYFAVLTAALFGDLLTTSRAVVSAPEMDVDQQFYAWRTFAFGELRRGRLPLWNPYNFGGVPALGNFQYAILYPPNWLHLLLPTSRAINLIAALHVFLAGVLAAAWCRSRRSGAVAAALGGTVFALGGPYVLHLYAGHLSYLCVVAWTPLVFLAVDRIVSDRATRSAWILGAIAVAMQVLGGYPQPAYYTALAVLVYVAVRLLRAPPRAWGRVLVSVAMMYALGAALAAAQLLPALDAARESLRAAPLPLDAAASYALPLANLLTLIAPYPLGDDFAVPYAGRWVMWETSLFVGPAALVLATLGTLRSKRRIDRAALVVALLAIVVALGSQTPVFTAMYHALPGFDRFRAPARFGAIAALMLGVLAAHGFDLALRRRRRATSRLAVAALVGAGWVAALALLLRARPEAWAIVLDDPSRLARSAEFASTQFFRTAAVLAQAGVVLLLVRRLRWLAYALAVLLVADLAISAGRTVERFQPLHPGDALAAREAAATNDRRAMAPPDTFANVATELGYEHAWGYDPAAPSRWATLVGRLVGANPREGDFVVRARPPSPVWSMLRVDGQGAAPLPRVLLIDEARVVANAAASLEAVLDPAFDPRLCVVLESEPSPLPLKGAVGSARVTWLGIDALAIFAEVDRPVVLVVTDAYSAGWRARGYSVLPANHALRAIPLTAGKHHLLLEYAPLSAPIGMAVSALAWLGLGAAVAVLAMRRLAARRTGP